MMNRRKLMRTPTTSCKDSSITRVPAEDYSDAVIAEEVLSPEDLAQLEEAVLNPKWIETTAEELLETIQNMIKKAETSH